MTKKGMLLGLGWIDAIDPKDPKDPTDCIDSTWWMDEGFGGDLPRPTLRGSLLCLSPSCASGYAFACMSTIRHLRWQVCLSSPEQKVGFAKKHCLWLAGHYRVRRPVGELPFWEFFAPIIWLRWVGTDFLGLFGFGPKPGGFLVQKRNETPETPETLETLCVDAEIAFL